MDSTPQTKAGRAPRAGVRLQPRDIAILEALIERRCETFDYLHEHFFPGLSRKRALNRLRDLQRAGLLERGGDVCLWGLPTPVSIYQLGKAAKPVLELHSLLGEHFHGRSFGSLWLDFNWPKQIAINRIGDWLGIQLLPEPLFTGGPTSRRHWSRPDAIYQSAEPDVQGRDHVYVIADLGGATPDRQLAKVKAFLDDPKTRSLLHINPTEQGSARAAEAIRQAFGDRIMDEVQPLTFEMIREGGWLDPGTEPLGGHSWQARRRATA
jgi:hypothetical protein